MGCATRHAAIGVAALVWIGGVELAQLAFADESGAATVATDGSDEVIIMYDERSPEAERGLDDPAFVTVVRIDETAGETTSVAEVLAKSIGVHVRTLGGLGSFSSLSVRGASSGHTAVMVDGVPLSQVASVSADIGRYELGSFSELELFRGGVPVELGGAAMGGALNLVTRVGPARDGRRLRASVGGGSFGARHARARWLDGSADGIHGYHLAFGYAGASGDFDFFDNRGTNLNPDDDRVVERQNNHYDQIDAVARYRRKRGDTVLTAGARSSWKHQGIPGSATVQATRASLETFGQLADLALTHRHFAGVEHLVATAGAFVSVERQHYRDINGEIGVGNQDRRYWTIGGGASGSLALPLGGRMRATVGASARVDVFSETDALRAAEDDVRLAGNRIGLALTLADDIVIDAGERIRAQLAVRLDLTRTAPVENSNGGIGIPDALEVRSDVFPSPRAALRARVVDGVVIKGSGGWYYRAPTLLELFGDRGFVVGNPALEPETGLSVDAGVVVAPARGIGPVDRIYAEFVGFARRPRDTIAFATGGSGVAVARNLGDAEIRGVEASLSMRIARIATIRANYTGLVTTQVNTSPSFEGKRLPQRPTHQFYSRIDADGRLAGRRVAVWADFTHVAGNYLDSANLVEVPGRRFIGAGVKFEPVSGVLIGVEGKNLTDRRVERFPLSPPPSPELTSAPYPVADFFGYPLPGRAVYATLEWSR